MKAPFRTATLDAGNAWKPLPPAEWTHDSARHLASRLGFSINPRLVDRVTEIGPAATLNQMLGQIRMMPQTGKLREMDQAKEGTLGSAGPDGADEQRKVRQAMRRQQRQAMQDYAHGWYAFARDPVHSAQEKLTLFFENVWVVAYSKVRDATALFDYQQRIRRCLGSDYPEMCLQLARAPAMVRYLDLNRNRKESPNENFARELFELFCLGEGNYTEQDVKEAARALTGFTLDKDGQVRFRPARHDSSRKTIFGVTGYHDLPKLIELIFRQPAAARFLPRELVRYYLTEDELPEELIEPLAEDWRAAGFSIPHLLARFFLSRIFHDPAFRGNMIKTPVHFYIGLLQDLDLDVFPSPRRTGNLIRLMGQPFLNPPNVRGWIGGRQWINSATLSARRHVVQGLLEPVPSSRLNADEERAIERAAAAGEDRFTVAAGRLGELARLGPAELAEQCAARFHIGPDEPWLEDVFTRLRIGREGAEWVKACLFAALTAPAYNLC
jgi:uncharacterized protein (DUF1800 family)